MGAEHTSPVLHTSEGYSVMPDEKRPASSKELTSAPETKHKLKGIQAFLPWSKKASNDGGGPDNETENAKAAETPVPASFFSLFRLDHPTCLTESGCLPTQVFNSL